MAKQSGSSLHVNVNPDVSPTHGTSDSLHSRAKRRCYIPTRLVLVVLLFLANVMTYGMRVNLSIALVAMVKENNTDVHQHYSYCKGLQNDTHRADEAGQFDWDIGIQSVILSSFYYGYLFTQIPGSCTSVYFSAKWTLGLSVFFSAILNFLTPLAANHGYIFLIGTRVLLGLVQGVYFPAVFHLLGLWLPPRERTSSYSFVAAGTCVGSTVFLFISGVLASSNIMQGWPSVFYFSGIAGIVWCLMWFPLAYNSPSSHPWISESEKEYIMESLKWNKRASGFLSGLPWILQPLMGVGVSLIAEYIIRAKLARVVVVRKGLSLTGMIIQCSLFIVTANSNCNTLVAITCFVTAITFGGLYSPGFYVNRLDIAPNSAGVLSGMVNVLTTLGGIAGPLLVALIVGDEGSVSEWKVVFWIISGLLFVGVVIFVFFGSGQQQSWDKELATSSFVADESTAALLAGNDAKDS
ncbi:putative sialin-like isoform X1 [Apostichopus japonicus]|uniref:Putative sialin-like isoform X1 n=1 Tax=Stichopus japonicus TaxID=307972 RepID=A0A2G8JLQ7_STIJA|nr:putative sialin-like isoform X1 [Apostichopus japonicus]